MNRRAGGYRDDVTVVDGNRRRKTIADRHARRDTSSVSTMRLFVRTLAVALVLVFGFIYGGQFFPEGSWFNDAADSFAQALQLHWAISPVTPN